MKNWQYAILIVIMLILNAISVAMFRYGFFTGYDEAFFLISLKEAYEMSSIPGASQWSLLAIHWFPYLDLTSKVNSYIAATLLNWFSIFIMSFTACSLYDKNKALKYVGLILLVYFINFIPGGLSYVVMDSAVISCYFCCFMFFNYTKSICGKGVFAILCGFSLGLSCFIILPSGLILLLCTSVLIIYEYWSEKKVMLLYLLCGIVGVLLAIFYVHTFICDIRKIFDAMCFAASYIGKSGTGYDSYSFLIRYLLFFRDYILVLLVFTGAYYLSRQIKNRYIGGLIYVLLMLVYSSYQVKPAVTPCMILVSVVIVPFLFDKVKQFKLSDLLKFDTWLYVFMLLFPIISSFGTNTYLGYKISCYSISWLFLYFLYDKYNETRTWDRVIVAVIIILLIPLYNVPSQFINRDDSYHFTRGNKYFAELAITEKQKKYFDAAYDILEKYNYKPNKSIVFTACFDYCSLYAFDAVNSSNFHLVKNFHCFDKSKMLKPDFVFMCSWDSIVIGKELSEMSWGWPNEFDVYDIGTPEPDGAPWVLNPDMETRKLYCRKMEFKQ